VKAESPALPVHYIRVIADRVRERGADVENWLAEAGLTSASLADASLTISRERFERLVLGSLTCTDEPALGLFVGERLVASTHGILGYAAVNAGTLREAMELLERYSQLRLALLEVSHDERAGQVRLRFTESEALGAMRRPVLEAVLLSVKNILDAITMGACAVTAVAFTFERPAYAALARDMFRCEVRYGQSWTGMTMAREFLDVPLKMADPEAFRDAAALCRKELDKVNARTSLARRVHRILLERQGAFPTLQVTARMLHLSPRTLHRRLVDEGTSYRALVDDVRHALAVEHLRANRTSVEAIAFALGYTDLANFRRAFKRWEGVAPSEFRERDKGPGGRSS
jgi:AraC-like DNA-binding protein